MMSPANSRRAAEPRRSTVVTITPPPWALVPLIPRPEWHPLPVATMLATRATNSAEYHRWLPDSTATTAPLEFTAIASVSPSRFQCGRVAK